MVHPFISKISIVYTRSHWLFHFSQQVIIEHLLGARPEQASQESPKWMGEMEAPETFLSTVLDVTAIGSRSLGLWPLSSVGLEQGLKGCRMKFNIRDFSLCWLATLEAPRVFSKGEGLPQKKHLHIAICLMQWSHGIFLLIFCFEPSCAVS